jgi:phage recombination protein Bet
MSTAIQPTPTQLPIRSEFDREKIELIKQTVARGTTDTELQLFLHSCQRTGLDPLAKQIYAIKRGSIMTIQTGIDGFRLTAERTGKYAPGREPKIEEKDGRIVSATAYVQKFSNGVWHEVAATAYFDEYRQDSSPMWKKMPRAMLSKCAEALALRKAFPADLSGLYTTDEMMQADNEVTATAVTETGIRPTQRKQLPEVVEMAAEVIQEPAPPSGLEPEWEALGDAPPKPNSKQLVRMFTLARKHNLSDNVFKAMLKENYGVESSKDLTLKQYEEICTKLEVKA